ncbi:hypothetical protein WM40_22670 [Robbsia andropogonis]|uniref:Uncharacterized protein n=1 Tax=Robbsia andropogonis TaxID=28092 RepID=A0A0F5JWA9_9BURK|nr:hypothetical protein [Robbsia andropogonis]KKB61547.1 hypothetical protein WM40_22670 [Robbsia andropogonis]
MAFTKLDPLIGMVGLGTVDPVAPGVFPAGSGRMSFPQELVQAYDPNLGGGEFMVVYAPALLAPGTIVQINQVLSNGVMTAQAVPWTGTANASEPLGVVYQAITAGGYGWVQVQGNAVVNVSGAPVAGNPVYWQAAGVVSPTAVAGKQVLGAKFGSAPGVTIGQGSNAMVLTSTQAIITMQRSVSQGAIT